MWPTMVPIHGDVAKQCTQLSHYQETTHYLCCCDFEDRSGSCTTSCKSLQKSYQFFEKETSRSSEMFQITIAKHSNNDSSDIFAGIRIKLDRVKNYLISGKRVLSENSLCKMIRFRGPGCRKYRE
jgi:hypothetical protein